MTTNNYRPQIGETLFVSLYKGQPFRITVSGYHHDKRFSSELIDYVRDNGRSDWSLLDEATFYPGAPADAAFIYVVTLEEHEFMEAEESYELAYFFDPQSAFDHIDAIKAGTVKPRHAATREFSEYSVRVEKV